MADKEQRLSEDDERLISDAVDRIVEAHDAAYGEAMGFVTTNAIYDEMRAAITAARGEHAANPNWKIVPRKATKRMLNAVSGPKGYCSIPVEEAWEKMLKAAPAAPAPVYNAAKPEAA